MLDAKWADCSSSRDGHGDARGPRVAGLAAVCLRATDELGPSTAQWASAIRSELRALLREVPSLVDMTMMDGLPTASPDTAQLAARRVRGRGARRGVDRGGAIRGQQRRSPPPRRRRARSQLPARVRRGTGGPAAESDRVAVPRARSREERARPVPSPGPAHAHHGRIGVRRDRTADSRRDVAAHGDAPARGMGGRGRCSRSRCRLYRCLEKSGEDAARQQQLYLRICRLDPVQAMGFGPQS